MIITRSQLRRSLEALRSLDLSASPYLGLQWTEKGIAFYRTSNLGYVRSLNFDRSAPALVASLSHLTSTLETIRAEELDLERDRSGMLRLSAHDPEGVSEVRIYTLRDNVPWAKQHRPGSVSRQLNPETFSGIQTKSFTVDPAPVVKAGTLMLPTIAGIVMRHGIEAEVPINPRHEFLVAIQSSDVEQLMITEYRYWMAVSNGFEFALSGHQLGSSLFDSYHVPSTPITDLLSARMLQALDSANRWTDDNSRVEFDAKSGCIQTRDPQGNPGNFSFAQPAAWENFAVTARTAKTMRLALEQSSAETLQLAQVDQNTLRMTRGLWEINFKVFR